MFEPDPDSLEKRAVFGLEWKQETSVMLILVIVTYTLNKVKNVFFIREGLKWIPFFIN